MTKATVRQGGGQKKNETCNAVQLKKMQQKKMRHEKETMRHSSVRTEKRRRGGRTVIASVDDEGALVPGPKILEPLTCQARVCGSPQG